MRGNKRDQQNDDSPSSGFSGFLQQQSEAQHHFDNPRHHIDDFRKRKIWRNQRKIKLWIYEMIGSRDKEKKGQKNSK